jgi:hypothetical protein
MIQLSADDLLERAAYHHKQAEFHAQAATRLKEAAEALRRVQDQGFVSQVTLIDDDVVDRANLNRVTGMTRLEQLHTLLREQPLYRREILQKTAIPKGTLGVLLHEKNGFSKREDGRWGLKPSKEG